jgi:hypothetical protein
MHFFRSEEHLRNWDGFEEGKIGGIISLDSLMCLFSVPYFTRRRDPDYFSHISEYLGGLLAAIDDVEDAGDYWRMTRIEKMGFSVARRLRLV